MKPFLSYVASINLLFCCCCFGSEFDCLLVFLIKSSSAAIIYTSLILCDCFLAVQLLLSVLQIFPPVKLNILLFTSVSSTFMLAGDKAFLLACPFLFRTKTTSTEQKIVAGNTRQERFHIDM